MGRHERPDIFKIIDRLIDLRWLKPEDIDRFFSEVIHMPTALQVIQAAIQAVNTLEARPVIDAPTQAALNALAADPNVAAILSPPAPTTPTTNPAPAA